jgi:beta-lactamase regulating signal transducer with metallopeptidase domain
MIPSQFQPIANHLWQSTLFAFVAGLLALVLGRYGPQARYVLSLAASAKFLIPFSILTTAGSWFGQHTDVPVSPPISFAVQQVSEPLIWEPFVNATSRVAAARESQSISTTEWTSMALWTVWGLGSMCIVFRWMRGWRQVRAALLAASPIGQKDKVQVLSSPEIREPGIVGIFRPILLLPQGIESYLTPVQLEAILQHEIAHVQRRDNLTGLIHRAVEVLFWFHPLVWWIGARLIEARERACDESVLRSGIEPEAYGEGILKICELYLKSPLPFVTGVTGSNLKTRMEEIMRRRIAPKLSSTRKAVLVGTGVVALAAPVVVGVLNVPILKAQSQLRAQPKPPFPQLLSPPVLQPSSQPRSQPEPTFQAQAQAQPQQQHQSTPPEAVWTPSSDAPKGLLTPREVELHDRFIDRARAGNIDVVFFGSTATEMWLWQDRGRSVWDQKFGSLKAASFGSQGTRFNSLLWRMQHGELDGYQAKLVVVQAQNAGFAGLEVRAPWLGGTAVRDIDLNDYVSKYAAIIAEIRARQPQARILLFGVFPRYQTDPEPTVENAALTALGNNETVFFIDISNRFFRPDGTFDEEMWRLGTPDPGIQKPAFEVWAQTLEPWLERFVR